MRYSLKHDSSEGLTHFTVVGSRDAMTTHKDSSVMGKEICSQRQVYCSGHISTGTHNTHKRVRGMGVR